MPTDRMARNIQRHHERLMGAIRKELPRIIANEDVITAPDGRRLRVPVRYLDEPRFRPARPQEGGLAGASGQEPGNEHRDPAIEVELTIEELSDLLFEELHLPNLQPKVAEDVDEETAVEGITNEGPRGRLHLKRTLVEHLKHGSSLWSNEDLRYRDLRPKQQRVAKSVIVFVRDASASMDEDKRYRVRAAAFWALRWLRRQYDDCQPVFILHDTAAEEVDEKTFFQASIMGGTALSSGVALALEILGARFPAGQYNRYVVHFSDGENWHTDNERLLGLVRELHDVVELYAYCEVIANYHHHNVGAQLASRVKLPRVKVGRVASADHVSAWLRETFGVDAA